MKLEPGAVIKVNVELGVPWGRSHTRGYWLVCDIHNAPFTRAIPPIKAYGVVRCTSKGKPFKYTNGFGCDWIDGCIENGKVVVIRNGNEKQSP